MLRALTWFACFILVGYLAPIALRAAVYWSSASSDWWAADRSSARLLPPAGPGTPAALRVYAARTVSWRGLFAVHSWIVLKAADGPFRRYDLTAWGEPIRIDGFAADGRWFGQIPTEVLALDGTAAANAIPFVEAAIATYRYRHTGDYAAWPGPNSNTFIATLMAVIPDAAATLPPTAIGKDYPVDGRWLSFTPSGTGVRLTLGGYAGMTVAWVEGVQLNLLGLVAGFDVRRPALCLPGFGRLGLS